MLLMLCLEMALERMLSPGCTVLSVLAVPSVLPVMVSGVLCSGFLVSQDSNRLLLNVPQFLSSEGPNAKATGRCPPSPFTTSSLVVWPSQEYPREHSAVSVLCAPSPMSWSELAYDSTNGIRWKQGA